MPKAVQVISDIADSFKEFIKRKNLIPMNKARTDWTQLCVPQNHKGCSKERKIFVNYLFPISLPFL